MKDKSIKNLLKAFDDEETKEKVGIMKKFLGMKKKNQSQFNKMVNNYNLENPKKFKNEITEQRKRHLNENSEFKKDDGKYGKGNFNKKSSPGQIKLHNFRKNKN